jgi:Rieske Fe-S protein
VKRRTFLSGTLAGGAMVAVGGCGNDVEPAPEIPGAVDDDPSSPTYGQVPIEIARVGPIGAAVTVRLQPPSDGRARPFRVPAGVLLIHRGAPADPPEWAALESTCTHAACPLGYSARDQLVECPCHASRFRTAPDPAVPGSCAGDVVHLPAKQGPPAYQVDLSGDGQTAYIVLTQVLGCKLLPPLTDGKVTLSLADQPQLANPGGSVIGTPQGFTDPIAVIRVDAATFAALDARCTHLGCTVAWDPGARHLQCPCHESAFALDGSVLAPPAVRPLRVYPVAFDGSAVVVTLV